MTHSYTHACHTSVMKSSLKVACSIIVNTQIQNCNELYTYRWLLLTQLSTVDMQEYVFESSAETPATKQMKNYHVPKHSKNCLLSYQTTAQINPTLNKGKEDSYFDRNCKKVLQRFCQKWHPPESRCEYMATFSMENWKQLPLHLKRAHTMSNCQGCVLMHEEIQSKFPDISVMTVHQLQSILQLQNSTLKCLQNLSRKMWSELPREKLYLSLIQLLPKQLVAHSQKPLCITVQQKRFKKSQPTLSGKGHNKKCSENAEIIWQAKWGRMMQ